MVGTTATWTASGGWGGGGVVVVVVVGGGGESHPDTPAGIYSVLSCQVG